MMEAASAFSSVVPNAGRPQSLFRGVHWCSNKQRWRAEIEVRGVAYKLGRHATEQEAARAYDAACIRLGVPERCNQWWDHTADVPTRQRAHTRVRRSQMRRARA